MQLNVVYFDIGFTDPVLLYFFLPSSLSSEENRELKFPPDLVVEEDEGWVVDCDLDVFLAIEVLLLSVTSSLGSFAALLANADIKLAGCASGFSVFLSDILSCLK